MATAVDGRRSARRIRREYFARERDYTLRLEASDVLYVDDSEGSRHVVSFVIEDGNSDTTSDAAITLGSDGTQTGSAAIAHQDSDGAPQKIEAFSVENGRVQAEVGNVQELLDDDVSAQYSVCNFCQDLFGVACAVGCGVGIAVICALMGVSVVGGIACSAVAAVVCYFIGQYGCSPPASTACAHMGYC